ncbi:hypothetical protein A1O3_02880 [Capronia epimyces CBS 606.96]|uniref:RBR-type E3 ubiquitin transferase n=1 Tax=Capronia epimyces CBS 606.96 TaxID=1182542 RepID=W9YBC0_9EURO|nr:uncharacterized protein A1O3_02880 [Capronia epimyces CBS 606.96]EXJ89813.1 hypothetical protein A1O3_02880 [Capronia epimyces CBS 606.96]
MAGEQVKRRKTYRRNGDTGGGGSRSRKSPEDGGATSTSKSVPATARPADLDLDALRNARLAYLATSPEERRKEMKYEYVKRTRTVSLVGEEKERRRKTRDDHIAEPTNPRPSRTSTTPRRTEHRRRPVSRDDSEDEYVYQRPERESAHHNGQSLTSKHKSKTTESGPRRVEAGRRVPERSRTEPGPAQRQEAHDEQEERPKALDEPETALRRSTASVDKPQRPAIKRSATTTATRSKTEVGNIKPLQPAGPSRKAPGFLDRLLPPKPVPQKKVSCLTCGDDDIPIAKSARLPCTHRMCHSCLTRIFTMSVEDPAHMPPRCCTDKHIDLYHVEKLFNQKFKVLWNRKFEEYKTKNRIYCPARNCGAWIKPHYITREHGRKVGRCKRCKTRVCATCCQKMHTSRDCPKDPETTAFIEVAKKEGWRRCYNCSAMVELKEGCNHMTCRCTAEFCMVCGLKWKSCDCPWFNYQAVDVHLGDPVRYQVEMDRRREQVNRDEALARRLQQMGLVNAGDNQEGAFGLGNAANHHLNQNFIQQAREALTANYAQAGQAARDLINGLVTGRENRLPGMPMEMEQMLGMLGGGGGGVQDPAEEGHRPEAGRRTARRTAGRRRTAAPAPDRAGEHDGAGEGDDADPERRLREWANRGPA